MISQARQLLVVFPLIAVTYFVRYASCRAKFTLDCAQDVSTCGEYPPNVCQSYPEWSRKNCPIACGICQPFCPEGWTYYKEDKTCFKIFGSFDHAKRLPWLKARKQCVGLGGDLTIIRDSNKNDVISAKVWSTGVYFWIGVRNVADKGFDFEYVDGTKVGHYENWLSGNPDNDDNREKCVILAPEFPRHTMAWNDYACTILLPYICSKTSNNA